MGQKYSFTLDQSQLALVMEGLRCYLLELNGKLEFTEQNPSLMPKGLQDEIDRLNKLAVMFNEEINK